MRAFLEWWKTQFLGVSLQTPVLNFTGKPLKLIKRVRKSHHIAFRMYIFFSLMY